jgi:hypothetical protein
MPLRPPLQAVVNQLLTGHPAPSSISLDQVGQALDTLSVSTEEIEAIFVALETAGCTVSARAPGGGTERLKQVVDAARSLKAESVTRPTLTQVAERAGLTRDDVLGALFLLRIMQRP